MVASNQAENLATGELVRRIGLRAALADRAWLSAGIRLALVQQLYSLKPSVVLGSAAGALLAGGLASWRAADPWPLAITAVAALFITSLLPLMSAFHRAERIDATVAHVWERRWLALSSGYSFALGAMAVRAYHVTNDAVVHMIVMAVCLAGVTTVQRSFVRPRVLSVQLGGLLVVPAVALAATGDPTYVALAVAGAALVHNAAEIGLERYRKEVDGLGRNARFRATLDNMHHGLCMFSPDRRLLVHNDRYLELFGFSPEVVRPGISTRAILEHSVELGNHSADTIDELHEQIVETFAGAQVSFLHAIHGKTLAVTHSPMRDGGWVATFEDITERLTAEAALRESERKLSTLVGNLPGVAYRSAPVAPWPLEYVSEGAFELTGHAADAFISGRLTWADVMHPDDVAPVEHLIEQALGTGQRFSVAYRVIHRSGEVRWVLERSQAVYSVDGELQALEGFIGDITEQKAAEAKLRQLQAELFRVSRVSAMGAMGAAIAHELNQPLAAASNYAAAVRLYLARNAPPLGKVSEAADRLGAEVLRAGEIIRRLRRLVASGEAAVADEDLAELVEDSDVLALVGAREAGVTCRLELAPGVTVAADRVQIQQVLVNLVRNAVEAMRDTDRRELVIASAATGGEALVAVQDSGPGLPQTVKDHLFEPFSTTKESGMGIGLSICRTIVEAHGGRIWAEDASGGGTRFAFTLPLAEAAREDRQSAPTDERHPADVPS